MATGDSARFGRALPGEATRGAAAGGAPAGRPRAGLGEISTDLQAPASDPPPPYGELPPLSAAGELGPDEDEPAAEPPLPSPGSDAFAEFEASMASARAIVGEPSAIAVESTRIEDRELLADQSTAILDEGPALPFLFVEAGKDRGREYVLQEGETSIGRGIDNDVILADVSVSRKHVRVLREGSTITLRDLGSGNGSLVNGRKAHVVQLSEGDRIEIGETVLVLRVPDPSIEEPATLVPDAGGGGATSETAAPVSGDVPVAGEGTFTPGSYPQPAFPAYPPSSTDALSLPPRDGATRSVVLPRRLVFIAAAAVAVLASMIGAGVATYLGRDDTVASPLPAAGATPLPVPAVAPSAPFAAAPSAPNGPSVSAVPAPTGPPGGVAPPPAGGLPAGAPIASAAGVPGAAALPSIVPPAAVAPPPVAPGARVETSEPEAVDEPSARGGRGRAATRTAPPSGSGGGGSGGGRAAALSAYRAANFTEAARLAREAASRASGRDRASLETLANDIESFAGFYPRLRDVGERYSSIERIATPAFSLDRRISGGHFTDDLRGRFVAWLVSEGEGSLAGNPVAACGRAMTASGIDAGHARVRALMDRCATRAADMLAEATRVERSDPARAQTLYRNVERMLPASHATAREAHRRAAGVGRTRTVDEDE